VKLFNLLYDCSLHLLALGFLPKLRAKKYRANFLSRLGKGFPEIDKKGRQLIWVHAVSLGETKAVAPLIKRLKKLNPSPLILLSTATLTGYQAGEKMLPEADWHVFLPFDLSYLIRPIVKRVLPDYLVLTETDFWYHFLSACKEVGSKLILINGKLSERSLKRFLRFPLFARHLLHPFDHLCVQGQLYRTRFERVGIPPSKLSVTGNLKLDGDHPKLSPEQLTSLKTKLGLTDQLVLTLGSTHHPEEAMWLKVLKKIWDKFPTLKVMFVPRHPERFNEVAKLLSAHSIPFSRWSEEGTLHHNRILLVDAMGVLQKCYQLSDVTFVGGSFTPKVGGAQHFRALFFW